jgi:hypothetical protein
MLAKALQNEVLPSTDKLKDEILDEFHERGIFSQDFGL